MTADVEALCYRQLAAAVVKRAVLDARSANGHSAEARRWLTASP